MTLIIITLLATALACKASAHGFLSGIRIDGKYYNGWNPSYQYNPSQAPIVAGWTTTVKDTGYVAPDDYTNADIICHRGASPGGISLEANQGSTIELLWNSWPESHHGPVLNYLARCDGPCEDLTDKTSLRFFKAEAEGLISGSNTGVWASDELIKNNNTAIFKIPKDIAPGPYVLRHEIIALHSANTPDGAQNYPQCVNLAIVGCGGQRPAGVKGTQLYTPTENGILFNLYWSFNSYEIPGPKLYNA